MGRIFLDMIVERGKSSQQPFALRRATEKKGKLKIRGRKNTTKICLEN